MLSFNPWSRDEENFCATVPKDGRSYSPTLFAQTVRVLKKINKPGNMIVSFSNLAERIKVRTRANLSSRKKGELVPGVVCHPRVTASVLRSGISGSGAPCGALGSSGEDCKCLRCDSGASVALEE